jgi:hypothetical protein
MEGKLLSTPPHKYAHTLAVDHISHCIAYAIALDSILHIFPYRCGHSLKDYHMVLDKVAIDPHAIPW